MVKPTSPSAFDKAQVLEAWTCVRKNNSSIPDVALDAMRDALVASLGAPKALALDSQNDIKAAARALSGMGGGLSERLYAIANAVAAPVAMRIEVQDNGAGFWPIAVIDEHGDQIARFSYKADAERFAAPVAQEGEQSSVKALDDDQCDTAIAQALASIAAKLNLLPTEVSTDTNGHRSWGRELVRAGYALAAPSSTEASAQAAPSVEVSVDYPDCRHVAPIKSITQSPGRLSVLVEGLAQVAPDEVRDAREYQRQLSEVINYAIGAYKKSLDVTQIFTITPTDANGWMAGYIMKAIEHYRPDVRDLAQPTQSGTA